MRGVWVVVQFRHRSVKWDLSVLDEDEQKDVARGFRNAGLGVRLVRLEPTEVDLDF